MIKFFRNIRRQLINQGKTSNYFKYAIGEIVLVVIGILIALQVNNWNNYRKDRNDEKMALIEIYQSLYYQNNQVIPYQLKRTITAEHGINTFLNLREQHATISDSVFKRLWGEINMGARFTYESGPFEAIKNRGLNLISNDSIRTMLVTLYETTFPRTQYFTNSYLDSQDYSTSTVKLQEFFSKTKVYKDKTENWTFEHVFENPDMLYSNEFLDYLSIKKEGSVYFRKSINPLISDIKKVMDAIDQELKIEKND
ncbi:DUF6090 family protein [Mangrovimonas sp. ST2L15]|uniref:DUF6090 family protein n=1 Tax=Mangrovimonas sp. ST2L15 TaxID=1645916 RepID=UPI0006B64AD0|nr:DUF6090 family protein [Mangrovimonas sp. ST2L15]